MELRQLFLTENACYKKGEHISPKGIMLHSTGCNNPNLRRYLAPDDGLLGKNQYGNHWNQKMDRNVCVHAFIGKLANGTVATYQTLPWDMRGWHCGGKGNDTHISIEICEDNLTNAVYFHKVYAAAVELCAHLCQMYKLDPLTPGVLIDHDEGHKLGIASNHGDVGYWFEAFGHTMDYFRADVARLMAKPEAELEDDPVMQDDPMTAHESKYHKVYKTLEDVPGWAKAEISELVDKGLLLGDGNGLNLSHDLVRTLVVLYRAFEAAGVL